MPESTILAPNPIAAAPTEDDPGYEVVNGQRQEKPPMGAFETWIAARLGQLLANFVTSNRLGRVVVEMLFLIDRAGNLQRRPDVAFVSYGRWARNRQVPVAAAWEVIPDLAVEIVGRSNTASEVLIKVQDYFRVGVRIVWVIYPLEGQAYVYHSPTDIVVRCKGQALDGEDVLPGFSLPLATLLETEDEHA